ncbi:hypothetical protein ACFVRU_55885, partial [Streptomyces sp. NPDC057927]
MVTSNSAISSPWSAYGSARDTDFRLIGTGRPGTLNCTVLRLRENQDVTAPKEISRDSLLRQGFVLEYTTLAWNAIGIVVLAVAAVSARSVALAGFGLDSLIEIGASTVVIWELSGTGEARRRRALRLIGVGFAALAVYLLLQSTWVQDPGNNPSNSPMGIESTALTADEMYA